MEHPNQAEHQQQQIDHLKVEQSRLSDRVLENEKAIALMVETSVAQGIKAAVADPATWDAFFKALSNRAQNQAGSVAVGGLKWLMEKVFWGLLIAFILYAVGGWHLLAVAVKGVTGNGGN